MTIHIRPLLKRTNALTSAVFLALFAQSSLANPEGGAVVIGSATITTPDPATVRIDQSTNRAIINWDSFNIATGETTQFLVPSAESWTLNRVIGSQDPSRIFGSITSNGNIVIVNPDGMHFGAGATVDVNRLIATTADVTNTDFMAGRLRFGIAGSPTASIVNEGTITAADYGLSALVAPSVRNSGIITARLGSVSLASGNTFTIDPYGDGLISLAIGDEIAGAVYDVATGEAVSDLVSNSGKLSANGGTVAMTAATARQVVNSVVNNTGVVEAQTVGVRGGKIILGGATAATKTVDAPVQTIRVSGTLDATGSGNESGEDGGLVLVSGENLIVDATIDVSGIRSGGTLSFGSLSGKGNEASGNTSTVFVAVGALFSASGVPNYGGRVFVLGDQSVVFNGSIEALGQGFAEISSLGSLSLTGLVNTGGGRFIIDPKNLEIGTVNTTGAAAFVPTSFVLTSLGTNNVVIFSDPFDIDPGDGDLILSSELNYDSAYDLTLMAAGDLRLNASIQNSNATSGDINLLAGWNGDATIGPSDVENADLSSPVIFGNSSGSVRIGSGSQAVPVRVGSRSGSTLVAGYDVVLTGGGKWVKDAHLGFDGTGFTIPLISGDILVRASHDIVVQGHRSGARIGHIAGASLVEADAQSISADIGLEAGNAISVRTDSNGEAEIGHVTEEKDNSYVKRIGGDILISAIGGIALSGNFGSARIGHNGTKVQMTAGGFQTLDEITGNINISTEGRLSLTGGATTGSLTYTQIGHGGALAPFAYSSTAYQATINSISGNININANNDVSLRARGLFGYSQIGHGGYRAGEGSELTTLSGNIVLQ